MEQSCADYGQALGTAFQVIDDVLDYDGDVSEMGKNLGDDLREGKTTLPLIIAMQRCTELERAVIRRAIETGGTDQMPQIIAIVQQTGALQATRDAAAAEAQRWMPCKYCPKTLTVMPWGIWHLNCCRDAPDGL